MLQVRNASSLYPLQDLIQPMSLLVTAHHNPEPPRLTPYTVNPMTTKTGAHPHHHCPCMGGVHY
jgi:hypothetical protein